MRRRFASMLVPLLALTLVLTWGWAASRTDGHAATSCVFGSYLNPDTNACVPESSFEFVLGGTSPNVLIVETDSSTRSYDVSADVLSSGAEPVQAADGTWQAGQGPAVARIMLTDTETAGSSLTLQNTICKQVDRKFVHSYSCYRRYSLKEGDAKYNYNVVFYNGTSWGKAPDDACGVSATIRCITWVKDQIAIAHKSAWCKAAGINGCSLVDWTPNGCCTNTSDYTDEKATLGVSVGPVSVNLSGLFTTHRKEFGLWYQTAKFYSRGWGVSGPNDNCKCEGRGIENKVGQSGGLMYRWLASNTRPTITVATILRDSQGYEYG